MPAPIVDGQNLDILVETTAVDLLVLDTQIWEVHVVVEVGQLVLARPLGDLVRTAVRMPVRLEYLSVRSRSSSSSPPMAELSD